MSCALFQPQDGRQPNEGETKVLDYLKRLPAGYFVIRELRISSAYRKGLPTDETWKPSHKQPDFIVIGPEIGIVSIEVKHWNLRGQQYSWKSQTEVEVIRQGKIKKTIKNPYHQAYEYWQWLKDVVDREGVGNVVTVSSVCAFPMLHRSEMLNQMGDPSSLAHPQMRFKMDLSATLFAETIAEGDPLGWLVAQARKSPQYVPASAGSCEHLLRALLPALTVGQLDRQHERVALARLTKEQEKWALSLNEQGLLMDVAGSGKTTVLLSKALHFVDRAAPSVCRVLVTAYSEDLARDLRHKLEHKVTPATRERYARAIVVKALPDVLRELAEAMGLEATASQSDEDLARSVADRLFYTDPPIRFDAVFVDEVQDLDNDALFILQKLCPSDRLFFVGDASQRLYHRFPEFESLGLQTASIALEASFRTYRTPLWIAKLANEFIWNDPDTRRTLVAQGYARDVASENRVTTAAEFQHFETADDAIEHMARHLTSAVGWSRPSDFLVITSEKRADIVVDALRKKKVRVRKGQPEVEEEAIVVVPFEAAKGLERLHVIILGIEDLYDPRKAPIHLSVDECAAREGFARRAIYVALTRTMETLRIMYWDRHNPYLCSLVEIQKRIDQERSTAA